MKPNLWPEVPKTMNEPELQTARILAQLRQNDPIAEQALATTIVPCLIKATLAVLPMFVTEIGKCLAENVAPDGYDPKPDENRCN